MESVASFKERTSGELHHLEIGMKKAFIEILLQGNSLKGHSH